MMNEGEYNNMPVARLAGLPPNPAGPGDIDAWIDWRDWLDEICGYWGAESTSVEALDASIHVKGFPSPGCFGTGGNDDSETADSRAARRIANEQDAQARADS